MGILSKDGKRIYNWYGKTRKERMYPHVDIEIEAKLKKAQTVIYAYCTKGIHEKVKYVVVNIARQLGKSFVARLIALTWMATSGVTVGYFTITNRLGREFYKKMLDTIPPAAIKSKNSVDLIIELVNGSRMIFFSTESVQAIRGFTLDFCIFDEVSHAREWTPEGEHVWYNIISPLMDARGKKCLFISTPNGAQGFFYEQYLKAKKKEAGYRLVECSIYGDETVTPEKIAEKRATYPEIQFRQEYGCEFLENGSSYFNNYGRCFCIKNFDDSGKLWAGVDFSSVGKDDTVLTVANEKGEIKQFLIDKKKLDEKYGAIASILNGYGNKLQKCLFESNSIGAVMSNEILKLLNPEVKDKIEFFTTTNKSKEEIIELLALDIEKKNISFMEANTTLREQFSTFSYKILPKSKAMQFGALEGYHDDFVMSLAICNYARHKYKITTGIKMAVFRR